MGVGVGDSEGGVGVSEGVTTMKATGFDRPYTESAIFCTPVGEKLGVTVTVDV